MYVLYWRGEQGVQLKYIELQGFKSFPDKTVISFGSGITAIVGPNGSGKSNIADAVRWVMGETSSKSLRGQKMEDVIFDGTSIRKPLGFAEVSLVLDNTDKTLDIAYDEVAITRRYYRSGESEYFINRSDVRLRDIQELLRDTGLGKTGYSIIGQGAITEIIAAKSSDRRALFEEAAGISGFKYKKDESLRKLNQTQENIIRLQDIIAELELRLGPLESQSKKARKYLALRDEKKGLEITLWVNRLSLLDEKIKKGASVVETFSSDISIVASELDNIEQEMNASLSKTEQFTVQIEQLRAGSTEQTQQIAQKQTQILVAKNDIEHAYKDIERIQNMIVDTRSESAKDAKDLEQKEQEAGNLKQALLELDGQITELSNTGFRHEKVVHDLHGRLDKIEKNIEEIGKEDTLLRVQLSSVEQNEQNQLKYQNDKKQEIFDVEAHLQVLEEQKVSLETMLLDISEHLQEDKNIRNGYESKKCTIVQKLEEISRQLAESNSNLDRKQNRLHVLQEMEKHYEGFQNSVKTVMTEAHRGTLTGIEGTVADILEVDSQYATAIETALGGALQNIITDNEQSGKNSIYFLKNRNVGRATFLPVSNIRGKRLDNIAELHAAQGVIGLAAELVKADNRYTGIVDFLLGRTVVCEDMDSAMALAKKNRFAFRVVTLDGQIVNVGGSLTGGSAARNFGILSRRNEIEELKISCSSVHDHIIQLKSKASGQKEIVSEIDAQICNIDAHIRVTEDEQIRLRSDLLHCSDTIDTVSEQLKNLNIELQELLTQRNSTSEERTGLKERLHQVEENLTAQHKFHANITIELNNARAQMEEISAQCHRYQLQRLDIDKNIESIRIYIENLMNKQISQSQSVAKLNEEISSYKRQISTFECTVASLESEKVELTQLIKSNEEEIYKIVAERTKIEQIIQSLRKSEKELYERKEKLSRELERYTSVVSSAQTEKEDIISKIWDEYELTLTQAQTQCVEIIDYSEAAKKVNSIKASMRALGEVNLTAVDEYAEVKERFDTMSAQVEDLTKSKTNIEKIIHDLTTQMTAMFIEQFGVINMEFEKVFKQLFNGGTAKLTLDDPENVLESGIEIYVAPPGKIIKHLSSLSGGEQSLTAIALYFAILTIRPAPFCLLDEIEAALDDVNVVRYAEYLRRNEKTQFIVITHRRGTMEAADRLYGVTMREKGISRILTIDVREIEKHI